VAREEGVSVSDLEPRIHDVLDAEALNTLFDSSAPLGEDRQLSVSFRYLGYQICVADEDHSAVTVEVVPIDSDS
jgi:hypothetical protein